jgi:arginine:pyruvate transaminase
MHPAPLTLANRIEAIRGKGSDGWDIHYKSRAMAEAGEPVLRLTVGEHDVRTHPSILAAMQASAAAGNTGYTLGPGQRGLRDAVAARVTQRTGVATSWRNVIITPGGQAALFAAHMATCNEGDRALFCDPYYATYPGTIRAVGAVAVPVPTRSRDAFLPQADVLAQYAVGARSLLINSPNNPTGVVYDRITIEGIAQVVRDHGLWLISDEVYDTQVWDSAHLSPRALPGMVERTIVVGSMSKSHAMTGFRVGWMVAPEPVVEAVTLLATNTTYGIPGFIQDAALFALNQGAGFEAEVAAPFLRRRAIAARVLAGQNVVRLIPSSGAMYLMLDIRSTGLSGDAFAEKLLNDERIAVMPGESFGQAAAGHLRVAMTIADAEFEEALVRLVGFAAQQVP